MLEKNHARPSGYSLLFIVVRLVSYFIRQSCHGICNSKAPWYPTPQHQSWLDF